MPTRNEVKSDGVARPQVDENGWPIGPPPDSYGAVIGANVQRLRAEQGMTQPVLARLLTATSGGTWTKGNVAALERGARPRVTVAEAVLFAHVLGVPIAELFAGDGEVAEAGGARASREDLRRALSIGDEPPEVVDDDPDSIAGLLDRVAAEIAVRLGASIHTVAEAARRHYGRTATDEHAARVGHLDDPTSQSAAVKRGNVTRQLVTELKETLAEKGKEA